MERIASFSVDHLLLEPGVYVSRIDRDPATDAAVTTFDLRLTTPNKEPVMNTAECHTIEHLGATFLRNHAEWSSRIVVLWAHGCRTGFYLVVFGEVTSEEILPLVRELFEFVAGFDGRCPPVLLPRSAVTTWTRTSPWQTGLRVAISTATWPISTRSTCTTSRRKGFIAQSAHIGRLRLCGGAFLLSGRDERSKSLMLVLECSYSHIYEQERTCISILSTIPSSNPMATFGMTFRPSSRRPCSRRSLPRPFPRAAST